MFKSQIPSKMNRPKPYSILYGILFCSCLTIIVKSFHQIPNLTLLSPLMLAVILGIAIRNSIGVSPIFEPGIKFCLKRLLKFAIVLLGLKLSLAEVQTVGIKGVIIVAISIISTFSFTLWLGRKLGIRQRLACLIATGTSICGASAIVATSSVIESSEEDVVYAISLVTVMGTIATFLYPIISTIIQLSPEAFGIWCGASIQDVAQVIAASFQNGDTSGMLATISKLSRVLFLIPAMITLSYYAASLGLGRAEKTSKKVPVPWFAVAFIMAVIINSFNIIPVDIKNSISQTNPFLLTISLIALGLNTNLSKISKIGFRPIYLAGISWIFLSVSSLFFIKIFGY